MIQSNAARKQPPTAEQERQTLARHEEQLASAQRAARLVRSALFEARASGDAALEAKRRQEGEQYAKTIADLADAIEIDREALKAAVERERNLSFAQSSDAIHKLAADFKTSLFRLADSVRENSAVTLALAAKVDAHQAELQRYGITPDPDIGARLVNAILMAYYLGTKTGPLTSLLGRKVVSALDDLALERSGHADIKKVAYQFYEATMQASRNSFGSPPEAA